VTGVPRTGPWLAGLLLAALAWEASAAAAPARPTARAAGEATLDARPPGRLRPETVASYTIDARLDAEAHRVTGRQTIRWRNPARREVSELCFHLYLNAFANSASSWMRRAEPEDLATLAEGSRWGWIELASLEADGADLLGDLAFAAPDDGNRDDRTLARVRLPRPVGPGETLEITAEFTSQLPRVVARTGHHRDFHLVAQWFPKLGRMERDGTWNCHQFHRASEFSADFGDYDVTLDVPRRFVVGATGRRVATRHAADGRVAHRYVQEGVHDFAWTAWPGFVEQLQTFRAGGWPEVEITLLLSPENVRFTGRYFAALGHGLLGFGELYGAYPYSTLTMVDPPFGADAAGGMEYPTFITTGTHVLSPRLSQDPEGVTVHELGHQWFYGLLATDEVQESYLDEGINTYATAKVLAEAYGPETWTFRAWDVPIPVRGVLKEHPVDVRTRYFRRPQVEPAARTTWGYLDHAAFRQLTYDKTALVFAQLERLIGERAMEAGMRDYASAWRFRHPKTADVVGSLSRAAGQDLGGYFRQTLYGSEVLDFEVASATSRPRRGPVGVFGEGEGREVRGRAEDLAGWESEVVVRRLGGVRLPVVTELVFADGRRARARWDGQERWVRFRVRGPRLAHAEVDPDETLLLDVDRINDSRRVEPDRLAARRWGQRVRFWIQSFLETVAALA